MRATTVRTGFSGRGRGRGRDVTCALKDEIITPDAGSTGFFLQ